jgi:hypothetical protein
VRPVSDAFLLQMAEISAGLIGLFLIGVFFYVENERTTAPEHEGVDRYFRASTRIVLVLYAIPIGLCLTLVVMAPIWSRILFVLLSVTLIAANVDTASHVQPVARTTGTRILSVTEVLGSVAVVAIVAVPWILGGLHPDRQDLAWSILLAFATGFLSIYAMVMSAFDLAGRRPPS